MFSFVIYNNSYENEHNDQHVKYNNITCETWTNLIYLNLKIKIVKLN